ncbi:MAG: hypothetical protein J6S04_00095 [Clostridia bacterium]|nr:hypothetical protein [Clostridia bacterium]
MKQYEDLLLEILSFDAEDIICTSFSADEEKEDISGMPDFPFLPGT